MITFEKDLLSKIFTQRITFVKRAEAIHLLTCEISMTRGRKGDSQPVRLQELTSLLILLCPVLPWVRLLDSCTWGLLHTWVIVHHTAKLKHNHSPFRTTQGCWWWVCVPNKQVWRYRICQCPGEIFQTWLTLSYQLGVTGGQRTIWRESALTYDRSLVNFQIF